MPNLFITSLGEHKTTVLWEDPLQPTSAKGLLTNTGTKPFLPMGISRLPTRCTTKSFMPKPNKEDCIASTSVRVEQVFVQPQAQAGEPHERFNWDAPILVSPHDPTLYFASYRVWKSTNRGDDWSPISDDLTRNEERLSLPIMGRKQSWDNAWDVGAMSNYNTITSLSESPLRAGLLYAGTDDGFIQVTANGGEQWTKIPVTRLGPS